MFAGQVVNLASVILEVVEFPNIVLQSALCVEHPRALAPVQGHRRPAVGEHLDLGAAGVDHGLDRNDQPILKDSAAAALSVVGYFGGFV